MYHYKDRPPMETVYHIRSILKELDIMPIEDQWINVKNKSYSVRLLLDTTTIGSNGKGITAEWALASAYGEFMERLQNQVLYPLFVYRNDDTSLRQKHGFNAAPDEKYLSISQILEQDPSIISNILPADLHGEDPHQYLTALSRLTLDKKTNKILCIPYYSVNTDSVVYLPKNAVSLVYGTNGMCAGNTPEEALVQGICEIIERYTNKMALLNDLTLPDIPPKYFSDTALPLIKALGRNKILKIAVKDASLGENLPAVSIVIINTKYNAYYVKFASHINFEVALERTLTELFQGKTIPRLEKGDFMTPFEYIPHESCIDRDNLANIFYTGSGIYNNSFFGNTPSFEPNIKYYTQNNFSGNKEYLHYVIQILLDKGWHILVRDVSFLGIPSYQVIIPGVSELKKLDKDHCMETGARVTVGNYLRDINACTKKELKTIAHLVESQLQKGVYRTIAQFTNVPHRNTFPLNQINYHLFLSALYLRMGDYAASHTYMKKYISDITSKNITLKESGINYYRCVSDYLAMLKEKTENINILRRIYGDHIFSEVLESINPEKAFEYYRPLKCPECSQCVYTQFCFYEKIRNIHKKIKTAMVKNPIDQVEKNRSFWKKFV
ncbi:MAG: YcaO-like family protein [Candidatus Methanofastidiosia archaeon]